MKNNSYSFRGYFSCENKPYVTYMDSDGVRNHKPPFQSIWDMYPQQKLLTGEFVDSRTGAVTDRFYGNCTDFNAWFVAKAARGEIFDVFITDTESRIRKKMDEVYGYFCQPHDTNFAKYPFRKNSVGKWEPILA